MSEHDDFFDPEYIEHTVTRHGKTKTFRIRELGGDEAERLFDIRGVGGKPDQAKAKGLDNRIIAKTVSVSEDGEQVAVTAEQAAKYPTTLRRELVKHALTLSGVGGDTSEADEKN